MKKAILLIFTMIAMLYNSQAQTQRLILAEEYLSCNDINGFNQNPTFNNMLQSNTTKVTSIMYHVYWPTTGPEPMNAHAAADVNTRISYYSVTGVPFCFFDGVPAGGLNYTGCPLNVTQAKIDSEYTVPSPFAMQLQQLLNTAQDSVFLTLLIHATQAVSGGLTAQTAEIEKLIHFATAPGTNGETDFYNVMVKMFPTASGYPLPSSWSAGDYVLLKYAWKLPATIYDKTQLASLAFVQQNLSKSVLQSCNSSTAAIVPVYARDATIINVRDVPDAACSNTVSPTITIQNNGSQTLTSLTIKYHVNTTLQSTYSWNGSLAPFKKANVTLPAAYFQLDSINKLYVRVYYPNGQPDEYIKNDSVVVSFARANTFVGKLHLDLKTDNVPQETTWELKKAGGAVVASGGPYTQPSTAFAYDIALTSTGCYTFTLNDAGGNGLVSGNGFGYYNLYDSASNTICQGTTFGYQVMTSIDVTAAGIEVLSNVQDLKVFPNPFSEQFNLRFTARDPSPAVIEIMNSLGEMVYTATYSDLVSGENNIGINVKNLASGIYILKITIGGEVKSIKITK